MITYSVETLDQCLDELKPLLENHWGEIAWYKDDIKLHPDYSIYYGLEELGALHIVTARDDKKLIGYYVSTVLPNPHYRDHLFSVNDILFILPEYRGGTAAYRMFKYAFKKLEEKGVSVITLHMKTDATFEKLCESLGMEKQEYLYSLYVGK